MSKNRLLLSLCLIVFALVLFQVNTSEAAWKKKVVDDKRKFSNFYSRAIAVDASNHPHIAYGGDHLYYAYYDGSTWNYQTVDSSPYVGWYTSIALDKSGKVHISYNDATNHRLKYVANVTGSWVTTAIGTYGEFTSLALDKSGKVQ